MYIDFDSLGKRIAQRRIALGYKQNELAEKLIYQITICQILKTVIQYLV